MRKMSEVLLELAMSVFRDPAATPSYEAACAALLLAHVAWNQELLPESPMPKYKAILREFEKDRPKLRDELLSPRPERLIRTLRRYKEEHHPKDRRWILVAGINPEKQVRVEFLDEPPPLETQPRPAVVRLR